MTDATDGWRFCKRCGQYKHRAYFYAANERQCMKCRRAQCRSRYADTIAYIHEVKSASGCVDCGYNEHPEVLDFDHREPDQKSMLVSLMTVRNVTREQLDAEIAKCDVVCANCHRLRTVRWREARMASDSPPLWRQGEKGAREATGSDPPFQQLSLPEID